MVETGQLGSSAPAVALWQTWGLRLIFAAMTGIMGTEQWAAILGGSADWVPWKGVGKSMLAALALLAAIGVFHPVKLLPIMLFEIGWKSVWLLGIALPAWAETRLTPGIVGLFWDCIGIIIAPFFVPWRYVWWRYFTQPAEPWRRDRTFAPGGSSRTERAPLDTTPSSS